jgi:hypothetical protein
MNAERRASALATADAVLAHLLPGRALDLEALVPGHGRVGHQASRRVSRPVEA